MESHKIPWFQTTNQIYIYRGFLSHGGTQLSSISIVLSIINHPFWGAPYPIFGNLHMDSRQELHHVFELVQAQFVPIDPGDRAKPGAREVGSCKKGFGRYASWVMPQLS